MPLPHAKNFLALAKDYLARLVVQAAPLDPAFKLVIPIAVPDAATSDIDTIVRQKIEVVDVTCRKDAGAGAGNTMTVKNAATAISNAIACDTDKTVTRAGTIDTASNVIADGGTLRLTAARAAGTRTALVLVHCLVRP